MRLTPPLLLLAALPLTLVACGGSSDEPAAGSTQEALGEPETAGFVTPDLDAAHEREVFAGGYTHLDPQRLVPDNLLFDAVTYYDANRDHLKNKGHVAVVDFAQHSGKKRFYLIDMTSGSVETHAVAHGSGSENGKGYSTKFSDTDGSHQSSLGFVVTGSTFSGQHGRSLLLFGLSRTNAHMRSRDIIIHSAAYVTDGAAKQGNSWGCFALDQRVKDKVVTALVNGALLYANLGKANQGERPSAAPPEPEPPPPPGPAEPEPPAPENPNEN